MQTFPAIEKLGGRDEFMRKRERALARRTSKGQVRMWVSRGRMPPDAMIDVMKLLERERLAYSASDFVIANGGTKVATGRRKQSHDQNGRRRTSAGHVEYQG